MEIAITDVLARRSDLATFIVHFTRKTDDGMSARENLRSILKDQVIEARTPFGPAVGALKKALDRESQHCVSFSETPLEHVYCLTSRIEKRQVHLSKYGLAFTRMTARKKGANPVWYVDIMPGHDWLMNPINYLIKGTIEKRKRFRTSRLAQITPFIEQMGTGPSYRKEFWWEREWRHRGDFHFSLKQMIFGFAPEGRVSEFERYTRKLGHKIPFVDPNWNLEKIIAHLCGCTEALTPFS
jgi:abortive phage resistance protein AbiGi (putative antitoxin)